MPELAEVEYYRKQWDPGVGRRVERVALHAATRDFRDTDAVALEAALTGAKLLWSEARAKQMLFAFSGDAWLGIHLGMTGKTLTALAELVPEKHDHLVLYQQRCALVFSDPRQFGRVRFERGSVAPEWWQSIPPALNGPEFTRHLLKEFLTRRAVPPIKAVLLMQERFPGVGNWMADEILWRARIKPHTPAGHITGRKLSQLYKEVRYVCQFALDTIGVDFSDPPESWLFPHRWRDGGLCPRTGKPLIREEIGGRTTCWSPAWQRWPA